MKRAALALAALFLMLATVQTLSQSVPLAMNFQGRLAKPDGTPLPDGPYNLAFSLYTAPTSGTLLWTYNAYNTPVRNGLFTTKLDFTTGYQNSGTFASLFSGTPVYLDISLNGGLPLMARQSFQSIAYAFTANTAFSALSVPNGTITQAMLAPGLLNFNNIGGQVTNVQIASVDFSKITNIPSNIGNAWSLTGNAGTDPATDFLGTTDNQPLTFKANNHQAMRYSYVEYTPNPNTGYRSINVLGGSEINSIATGVIGATIAGGGMDFFTGTDAPNQITTDFGVIGGGYGNTASGGVATVAGGVNNTASGSFATIGGGRDNTASGIGSIYGAVTIAGGKNNVASNAGTTIGGGAYNTASGDVATVAGGANNTASGAYAAIAGGYNNTAAGTNSFAAGQRAQANHDGTFVWNDASNTGNQYYFASTAPNQFLIHAGGNVGINNNNPAYTLDVTGDINARGSVRANGVALSSDARYKTNIATLNDALNDVLNLRGVSYNWNKEKWPNKNFPDGKQIGFIAQELEKIFPELVQTDKDGYKSVMYQNVVPVLVEAIKAQQKQIDELRVLKTENAELRKQLVALAEAVRKLQDEHNK